jgi:hypothetical protein
MICSLPMGCEASRDRDRLHSRALVRQPLHYTREDPLIVSREDVRLILLSVPCPMVVGRTFLYPETRKRSPRVMQSCLLPWPEMSSTLAAPRSACADGGAKDLANQLFNARGMDRGSGSLGALVHPAAGEVSEVT